MNHIEFDAKRQRNIELLVLVISTLYAAGFAGMITAGRWAVWDLVVIVVFIVLAWTFYLITYRTFRFRAYITFGMLQFSMVLYMLQVRDVKKTFATMLSLAVIIALYGLPELVWVTLAAYTFELAYHMVVTRQIAFTGAQEDIRLAIQIISIYMVQIVIYYVICRQVEASQVQDGRIEELKDAERSKDDFLANVSHEIRTPINTICGMSAAVLREDIPDHLREEVFSIQNAGQNLLSVVSDILDFSELESGDVELVEEEYNIASLANDVVNLSVAKKAEKRIELVVDLDVTIPSGMIGDEQRIRRVVMNFVDNAIKFTSDGGVSISFACRRENYGVNLTVTVKDTGIGMKKEHLEKIFTSFSQIDSKRNRQNGGLGLGLAISKAIIAKMGGFISVRSEYGKGSQIQFTIPQRVSSWEPVASVKNAGAYNVAIYINMEQFAMTEIRDEYGAVIDHMVKQSGVSCVVCQNLPELKRRSGRENFTHIFISVPEYEEDAAFFDAQAMQAQVMVALDYYEEERLTNPDLLRIYKPFFILPIIMALNGERTNRGVEIKRYHRGRFVATTAKILAVDDNRMNLKVLENLLKPYRLTLVSVTSGAEALESIMSKDYDFVFMDHMMPEMDGIETLKRIRDKQGNYFKTVPIIALTANSVSGMREMFLSQGFDAFLSKPIELSAMERVLRRFIPAYKIVDKPEDEAAKAEIKETKEPFRTPVREEASEQETGPKAAQSEKPAVKPAEKPVREPVVSAAEKPQRKEESAGGLNLQDLDVSKGVLYCGSMDGYIEVLKMHCDDGENNRNKIESLYAQRSWKEYSIYVHALKSSMMSIGAVGLSEMAKKLEFAAKADDGDYILSAHDAAMQEYRRVLDILKDNFRREEEGGAAPAAEPVAARAAEPEPVFVSAPEKSPVSASASSAPEPVFVSAPEKFPVSSSASAETKADSLPEVTLAAAETAAPAEKPVSETLPASAKAETDTADDGSEKRELGPEEFDGLVSQFEDAVYTLDSETMTSLADSLASCVFHGHDVGAGLPEIRRKIDMEDYMSALDSLVRLKDKWSKD